MDVRSGGVRRGDLFGGGVAEGVACWTGATGVGEGRGLCLGVLGVVVRAMRSRHATCGKPLANAKG